MAGPELDIFGELEPHHPAVVEDGEVGEAQHVQVDGRREKYPGVRRPRTRPLPGLRAVAPGSLVAFVRRSSLIKPSENQPAVDLAAGVQRLLAE